MPNVKDKLRDFFSQHEKSSAVLLLVVSLLALILANSPLAESYFHLLHFNISIGVGAFSLSHSFAHWVNDGLMAVFFFLVGLEIKHELVQGELSDAKRASLPLIGALGGMLAPALIYVCFNNGTDTIRGWAIPTATDIAFALGDSALAGSKVPKFLRAYLSALAIIDDLGAVLVIAFFYAGNISVVALAGAALVYAMLILFNRLSISALTPYLLGGALLWLFVLHSGVHATIAGVLTAFAIPATITSGKKAPLEVLEKALHPWVAFGIMPIFAFANAGVALGGQVHDFGQSPLSLGILLGLVLGKPLGIFGANLLAAKTGIASMPPEITLKNMLGVAVLAGIGFTMSLFIAGLAFSDPTLLDVAKISVLAASTIAGLVGYALLRSR